MVQKKSNWKVSKVTRCLLDHGITCEDESLVPSMAVVLGWYTFKMQLVHVLKKLDAKSCILLF